jgi:hypothetical protein
MADKEKDVSRAQDGKVKVMYADSLDLEVIQQAGDPPNVTALPGKKIEWLAYFDVRKKNKSDKNETVTYKIKVKDLSDFIFWNGGQPQRGQNWTEKEVTGDPAIGREA